MLKKHYSTAPGSEDSMMSKINEILQKKDDDDEDIPLKLQIADKFE